MAVPAAWPASEHHWATLAMPLLRTRPWLALFLAVAPGFVWVGVLAIGEHASTEGPFDGICNGRRCVQAAEQFLVVDLIEKFLDVDFKDPLRTGLAEMALDEVDGVVGAATFPKTILVFRKVGFPLGLQNQNQQRLERAVYQIWNTQGTQFIFARLGDPFAPDRRGPVVDRKLGRHAQFLGGLEGFHAVDAGGVFAL
jgi:hypothetical protein